ncbi:MAG: 2-dehydro-3-deoxygalactonokinase [Thalassovita sp.]
MTEDYWTGLVEFEGKTRSWDFAGKDLVQDRNARPRKAGPADIQVRAGSGPTPVPAPVLPTSGDLTDLSQDKPMGLLPAPVRLWLIGLTQLNENWDGVACYVTQDRTHWVQISANEAVSFQSYLTPSLIKMLAPKWPASLGEDALADSLSRPERLATHLSSAALANQPADIAGHLIGAELAAAKPYWLGQQVSLCGDPSLCALYHHALTTQGVPVTTVNSDVLTHAGLFALYQRTAKDGN